MEKNLIDIIAKSGIVGAGGAGFPTHVKMNAKAEYVIINGAECEPLLRVDQQLMAVETKKILDALKLCMEAVGADKGVIALKGHYEAAINSFNQLLGEYEGISLHLLPNFYPAGDEQYYSIRSYGKNCTRRWNSSTVWRYRFQCRDHA